MNDTFAFLIAISTLLVIIIVLIVEKIYIAEQCKIKEDKLLEENSRLVKAVIAKNANEYVMTASIDKVAPEEKLPVDPDLIPEESLSDDEFMKAINKDNSPKK